MEHTPPRRTRSGSGRTGPSEPGSDLQHLVLVHDDMEGFLRRGGIGFSRNAQKADQVVPSLLPSPLLHHSDRNLGLLDITDTVYGGGFHRPSFG